MSVIDEEREQAIRNLQPMIEKAEKEGLWFKDSISGAWFSPDDLRKHMSKGRFLWKPIRWELNSPELLLDELKNEISVLEARIEFIKKKAGIQQLPSISYVKMLKPLD
ncbi:hypothetical protein D1872_178470 [compost metagenome]